jgi:hypothetical protein
MDSISSNLSRQSTQMTQYDEDNLEEVKAAPIQLPPVSEDKYEKMMRELKETRERAAQTLARSAIINAEIN